MIQIRLQNLWELGEKCWQVGNKSILRPDPTTSDPTTYQRLQRAGKAKKVALTACMRKLLTIINAMLKHRTPWREVEASHA